MLGELSCTLIENIHTKFEKTLNYTSCVKLNLLLLKFLLKIMPKRTNIIVRCIYRHPDNNIDGFNTNCLMPLLLKLSQEFYLVTLIKNSCSPICSFLDELSSSYFTPQLFLPSHITGSTKTLNDNIFYNIPQSLEQNISVNLTSTYSDHLPQALLVPGFYQYENIHKSNVFICDWKTFNNATFSADYKIYRLAYYYPDW